MLARVSIKRLRILTILAREKRLSAEHFSQDASNRPHVDGLGVLLEGQHDFWRSVPTSGDVFGHETRVVLLRSGRSSETEIANLQVTVGVEKQVGGLQVTVKDVGGVHGFEGTEGLVNEVLAVVIGEVLGANDTVHISLHEFLHLLALYVVNPN